MSHVSPTAPSLPEGLRVPIQPVEGPTPAQIAQVSHAAALSQPDPLEERLFSLFRLIEDQMHPDIAGRYGALLQDIAEDQIYAGVTYYGLLRVPADGGPWATEEGGLVRHILAQWKVWEVLREEGSVSLSRDLPGVTLDDPDIRSESILQALINSALPQAWARREVPKSRSEPQVGYTHESDLLLSEGGKAVMLLQQRDIQLDGQLLHLLLPNPLEKPSPLFRLCMWLDESAQDEGFFDEEEGDLDT